MKFNTSANLDFFDRLDKRVAPKGTQNISVGQNQTGVVYQIHKRGLKKINRVKSGWTLNSKKIEMRPPAVEPIALDTAQLICENLWRHEHKIFFL